MFLHLRSWKAERKKYQTQTEDLQAQRNALSKEYGMLKKEGKEDSTLSQKIDAIKTELDLCLNQLKRHPSKFKRFFA
jgi:seryl-tRNA synthetase